MEAKSRRLWPRPSRRELDWLWLPPTTGILGLAGASLQQPQPSPLTAGQVVQQRMAAIEGRGRADVLPPAHYLSLRCH